MVLACRFFFADAFDCPLDESSLFVRDVIFAINTSRAWAIGFQPRYISHQKTRDAGMYCCYNLLFAGQASSPGFSEKTDFAWVPASVLLRAMRESRNRSTRKVVVKLGGCRYLRLFHKASRFSLDQLQYTVLFLRRPAIQTNTVAARLGITLCSCLSPQMLLLRGFVGRMPPVGKPLMCCVPAL